MPEHSVAFMKAMSGGEALFRDGFLFFVGKDWLIAIGYPLQGNYDAGAFARALETVVSERTPEACWAIAPELPPSLAPYVTETDVFYVLPSDSPVPGKLRGPLAKAAKVLRVEEGRDFTAAHRKLWMEFLRRKEVTPQVRELFARTNLVVHAQETDIRLVNAWDADGRLAACLVMDCGPEEFDAYIIGAHSRTAYTPHAGDALFAHMLASAQSRGKRYIHLGLGVNEGIARFKKKWGGVPALPFQAASWKHHSSGGRDTGGSDRGASARDALYHTLLSAAQTRHNDADSMLVGGYLPEQRPYAMLWKLTKNGKTSWIGGTAHSFRYSFAGAFRALFAGVDTVIFEGPLDAASLATFGRHGRTRDADTPRVIDYLEEDEIRCLERVVRGPQGAFAKFLNMAWHSPADVRGILSTHRPWSVFFTLYYAFLERHGWNQSVDLEAWEIAREMGRRIISMENIDEQTASLESVPMERIIHFLRRPEDWKRRMRQSLSSYLDGDLMRMLDTGTEFPTRTNTVIGLRDQRFRERMMPHIERGRTAVFVGTAHMLNLENMLREDGFTVTQLWPTLRHKLRAWLKGSG
ncbi:MAG: TraB/GumN family protein [Deltaproteobacteria bacterium]|nr:TraB/GumN family protein [Deltaproteobacteria bacterium]